jgi:hypothetical protein
MQNFTRKRALLAILIMALAVTAVAFAAGWFTGSGSGDTAAKGGSPASITLGVGSGTTSNIVNKCVPSANCDLSIGIINPSAATLTLATATLNGTPSVNGAPGCNIASHLTLNPPPPAVTIGPGTTSYVLSNFVHTDSGLPVCAADTDWTIPLAITATG